MNAPPPLELLRALVPDPGELREVVADLLASPGEAYFEWMLRFMEQRFRIDVGIVGELSGDGRDRCRTLCFRLDGVTQPNLEYALEGTPCAGAFGTGSCVHPQDVARLFPDDRMLVDLGAEAYVGMRLDDELHRPLGLVAVILRKPYADVESIRSALGLLRGWTARQVSNLRAVRDLEWIVGSTAEPEGHDVLSTLVLKAAKALRVRSFGVAERRSAGARSVSVVAACTDGKLLPYYEVEVAGSPCERVYADGSFVLSRGIRERYGAHPILKGEPYESYVGVVCRGAGGEVLGHVAIVHDEVLREEVVEQPLFRVILQRISFELGRRRSEAARMRAERSLLEAQKMKSLGVLAGGVAHDFNNLLVGIQGNVSLALADCAAGSPLRPQLEAIETASRRAAELARQMLAYSGQGVFALRPVDLSALVGETVNLIQSSLGRHVTLRCDLAPSLPQARADETQIRQVVMNLVLNAGEAIAPPGGTVTLRTGLRDVDAAEMQRARVGGERPPGAYLFFEVADEGAGMDADTVDRIFDPFFSTKFAGRGLGLAAVLGIVRGHRGALVVESAPGAGSTFRLLLPQEPAPRADAASLAADASGEVAAGARAGSILVVDDEEIVRTTIDRMLGRLGFEVRTTSEVAEALGVLEGSGEEVRLVLLDLTMPGLSGERAIDAIRAVRADVPIVLMSGYVEDETMRRFAAKRLAGFLQKPFRLDDLRERLDAALERC